MKTISGNIITTFSAEETVAAGCDFAKRLSPSSPVLLYGEMGAGKTRFVKGVAKGLGIDAVVTSPTFAIVNDYGKLFHFDLFRINSADDLYAIGFYDYIGKGVIVCEWSENVPELASEFTDYFTVKIAKIDENTREIEINEHSGV